MEVVIDWSSLCGYYSDTEKRMQQVVSEPSILGGERRLESRQFYAGITENRRKLGSQQSDARWEKNMQLHRNIISSKPGGEVAAADKESSPVEEEDQQVEIRWQQLKARSEAHWRRMDVIFDELKKAILDLSISSQGRSMETTDANSSSYCNTDFEQLECNRSPVQKIEELEQPQVDRPESDNLKSRDKGWDVHQAIATMDLDSGSHESQVVQTDGSLGNQKEAMEILDYPIRDLVTVLELPKIAEGGFDEMTSWNGTRMTVNGIDSELYFLSSSLESKDYPKVEKSGKESEEFGSQNQRSFLQPPARENAQKVNSSFLIFLSLKKLLVQFPKPNVKMKLVAQRDDELYEGFDDKSNGFLGRGGSSISDARGHSGIQWENESTLVEMQPDQRSGEQRHGLFDEVFPLPDFACNVFGVLMGLKRSSFGDAFRCVSRNMMNLVDGFMESSNLLGQGVIGSKTSVRQWKNLSDWEKLGNKRCGSKFGARVDNLGILADYMTKLSGLRNNYREFVGLITKKKAVSAAAGVLFSCQGINGKYMEMDERAATLERTGSDIVEGDINDVSPLKKHFEIVSFAHVMHLASQAGIRYGMENPISCVQSNIASLVYLLEVHKVAKPQPSIVWDLSSFMDGLNTKVLFSKRYRTDQQTSLYDAPKRAGYGLWGRLEMAYLFFTSNILKGNSIPIFEAATHETIAVGKSTGCSGKKMIHQLTGVVWLVSVLFPKPRVKMKVWEDKAREAWLHDSLWTRNLKGTDCYDHKL